MTKEEKLSRLKAEWEHCTRCILANTRTNVVFGYGNPDAEILIIGEAPGQNEDETGFPFIGPAGRLLDQYLLNVSVDSELVDEKGEPRYTDSAWIRAALTNSFFFTNVVACRPVSISVAEDGTVSYENVDPSTESIKQCRNRLLELIYIIDPSFIIAVGKTAAEALTGKKINITNSRGELFDMEMPGKGITISYPVLAVLHTSFLLRQNDFQQPGGLGHLTYNDFLKLMRILDEFRWRQYSIPKPLNRKEIIPVTQKG